MFILVALLAPLLGIKGTIWFGIVAAVVAYIYHRIKKRQSFWKNKEVKYVEPKFFRGFMEIIRSKSFVEKIVDVYNTYPDERYFGAYQFTLPVLIIKDPDLIKQIVVKEFDHFLNHRKFSSSEGDPFWSRNLFASRDERWKDLRSTLSPSFTSSKMKTMYSLIEDCAERFVDYFKQQNGVIELEMKETMRRFTNDVIATTAFGLKCDSLTDKNNEFYVMGTNAMNFGTLRSLKFFFYGVSPTLSKLLRLKLFPTYVSKYFSKIIEDTVRNRKEKNIIRPDMIHLLMEAQKGRQQQEDDLKVDEGFSSVTEFDITKNKRKHEITMEDINSQAFIFFIAGFDTVSTFLNFAFYELAVNPDVQERLRQEIRSVSGKLTYETLLGLKYLDMVVSEALRKWPPAVLTDREVSKDFTIEPKEKGEKPLHLEPGTICWIPIYALHRDERFYPNPEKFDPERFSDENKHKINLSVYLPFGGGPRNCIGSRFALLEGKLIIANVLKNFEVVPVEKTNIPMVLDKSQLNMAAKGGMWLGLKRIEK